ncbi:hypothetical protein ABVT39_007745 [Epinephelus coioides]
MIEGCVAVAAAESEQISYLAFPVAPSSLMSQVVSASAATLPWLPSLHTDMAPVRLENAGEVSGPSSTGQLDMGVPDTANTAAVDGLLLAALHFNNNGSREIARTGDGEACYAVSYPRFRKGDCVVCPFKEKPSYDDRNNLNSYNIKTCEDKLRELISYVNDPTGKPQRTIPDILGQISLLYQHKAELQAAETQEQLAQLQHDNSRLRQEVQARVNAASDSQEEDPTSATLCAFAITQRKQESPKEYYRCLRVAYFQGHNAPGLEEEHGFKSLFLHNLHETVRYDVAVYYRTRRLAMQEIRRAMLSLGKPLQMETCNVSITNYTQDTSPITRRAWVDITFKEMTLVHPIYVCVLDTDPLLIGQDLLDRLAPLIDCHRGHIWAQVDTPKPVKPTASVLASDSNFTVIESRTPLPMLMPLVDTSSSSGPSTPPTCPQPPQSESSTSFQEHRSFLCCLKNVSSSLYSPYIIGGVNLNGTLVPEAILMLWSKKSATD